MGPDEERRASLREVLASYRTMERDALAELRLAREKIAEVEAELADIHPTRDDDPVEEG